MSSVRADGGWPWVVPLRRVFPWWFLAGTAVTVAVSIWLLAPMSASTAVLWGPAIGILIRDRFQDAKHRLAASEPVTRRDLVGPWWVEPAAAAPTALLAIGLGLTVDVEAWGSGEHTVWLGIGLLVAGAAMFGALILVARSRKRLKAARQTPKGAS